MHIRRAEPSSADFFFLPNFAQVSFGGKDEGGTAGCQRLYGEPYSPHGTWAHNSSAGSSGKAKDSYVPRGSFGDGDDDDPEKKKEKWVGALARTQVLVLRSYRGSYNTLFALLDFSI